MINELRGVVLDEEATLSLYEICCFCDISAEVVMEMMEEGIVFPQGKSPREWVFCGTDVKRVQVALRLQHDLRVNLPGAALVLDLLEALQK